MSPMKILSATALVASLAFATPALAVKPFTAEYDAAYMGLKATGKMTLVPAGADRWKYSLDVSGMGAQLNQSTTFEDKAGTWRPLTSTDSQKGTGGVALMLVKSQSTEATYDWAKKEARWSGDVDADKRGPIALQDGDLDGMLLNLAVVRDASAGKPMTYRLVEDGRVRQQTYKVAGTETITVAGQSKQATKVVRVDGNRQVTAWIVDGMPVPARILQQRKGKDQIDLRLKSFR